MRVGVERRDRVAATSVRKVFLGTPEVDERALGRLQVDCLHVVSLRLLVFARVEVDASPVAMQEGNAGHEADRLVNLLDGLAPAFLHREDTCQVGVGLILLRLSRDRATEVVGGFHEFSPPNPHRAPVDEDAVIIGCEFERPGEVELGSLEVEHFSCDVTP